MLRRLEHIAAAQGKTLEYLIFDALLEYLAVEEKRREDASSDG